MSGKTAYFTKDRVERPWYVVDVKDQVFGRVVSGIAKLLIGKNRPEFTPGQDCGAFVVVVNADKFKVTGRKLTDKKYYRHTGYPGGIKELSLEQRMARHPEEVIRDAVWGMLPKNKLGKRLIHKLKVYCDPDGAQRHNAQKPVEIKAEELARL